LTSSSIWIFCGFVFINDSDLLLFSASSLPGKGRDGISGATKT